MLIKLIKMYVQELVIHKDSIDVREIPSLDKTLIEIKVAASDLAKVIGKEGKIFRALRSLINAIDPDGKKDIVVDIIS